MKPKGHFRVEDNRSYAKNPKTASVVNVDVTGYASRKAKLNTAMETEARLTGLENNMYEIKDMLAQLLGKE